jgi:hypothetical protein
MLRFILILTFAVSACATSNAVEVSVSNEKIGLLADLAEEKIGVHGIEDCAHRVSSQNGVDKDFSNLTGTSREIMQELYLGFSDDSSSEVIVLAYAAISGETLSVKQIADRSIQKKMLRKSLTTGEGMDVTAKKLVSNGFACPVFIRDAKKLLEITRK